MGHALSIKDVLLVSVRGRALISFNLFMMGLPAWPCGTRNRKVDMLRLWCFCGLHSMKCFQLCVMTVSLPCLLISAAREIHPRLRLKYPITGNRSVPSRCRGLFTPYDRSRFSDYSFRKHGSQFSKLKRPSLWRAERYNITILFLSMNHVTRTHGSSSASRSRCATLSSIQYPACSGVWLKKTLNFKVQPHNSTLRAQVPRLHGTG